MLMVASELYGLWLLIITSLKISKSNSVAELPHCERDKGKNEVDF